MESHADEDRLVAAENELARLREQLDRANQKAKSLKEELDGFVYAASHDLKAPLRSIGSYSQLLIRTSGEGGDCADYARFILEGVHDAVVLVDKLLNLSRAGASSQRSMVRLDAVVQSVIYKMQAEIREAGAEVVCNGPLPEVSINQADFERVFENLLDNAIKYRSEAPPKIEISFEEGDEGPVVSVRDNAVGIEPKYHDLVFVAFKRLHGAEIPGTGLGLAVCRKIVAAHEGQIWVESEGLGGSVFKVSLPY
jgi:signal transduction histidine kinase